MGAFSGASLFFNQPLPHIARSYGYGEDNILVLEGDLSGLKERFPETYQNILSCGHNADRRTPLDYARDLVASWLIEDSFLILFRQCGLSAALSGTDRGRKILSKARVSSSSDFSLSWQRQTRKLELMNDYTGFWSRKHVLHLRDNKYQKLCEEKSLFLAVSIATREFALYDFRSAPKARYISSHPAYGGKPAYELPIPDQILHPASSANISEAVRLCFSAPQE